MMSLRKCRKVVERNFCDAGMDAHHIGKRHDCDTGLCTDGLLEFMFFMEREKSACGTYF